MSNVDKHLHSMNPEKHLYALHALPTHLVSARQMELLWLVLTNFSFIEAKIDSLGPTFLIEDFDLALAQNLSAEKEDIEVLENLRKVIRLSNHILSQDKTQLVGQLIGHLILLKSPALRTLLDTAVKHESGPWLRPLGPSLVPPNQLLLQTLVGHEDEVRGVAITPDGRCAISIEMEKLIVWDTGRATQLYTLENSDKSGEGFQEIVITSDGQHVIVRDGSLIRLLDIKHGTELLSVKDSAYPLTSEVTSNSYEIYSSPTGNFSFWKPGQENELLIQNIEKLPGTNLAIYSASGVFRAINVLVNHNLIVVDIMSGETLFDLEGHVDQITSVLVSSDGQHAISASMDTTLKVWDLHQGILLHDLLGHSGMVHPVAMTPDGRRGISASAKTLKVWDLEKGIELSTLTGHTLSVEAVAITPDGRRAISGALDGVIKIWDLEAAENQSLLAQDKNHSSHHRGAVTSVAVTPNGELAISVSVDETITIWHLEKAIAVQTRQLPCIGFPMVDWRVHKLFNMLHFYYHQSDLTPYHGLTSVAITPDMRYIIAASVDNRLKIMALSHQLEVVDLITNSLFIKGQILTGHRDSVWTIAVTPDSRRVLSGSNDRTIKAWDLKQGKELYTLEHPDRVIAIAVTPDGRHTISATRSEVYKWNLRSKKRVRVFYLQDDDAEVITLVTAAKDSYVVSQMNDKSLKLQRLESKESSCTLSHTRRVNGVLLTKNAEYLISVSEDGILRVWSLSSKKIIASFNADNALVSCAIAPDELTILAGDELGRVHFLRVEGLKLNDSLSC